MTKFYKANKAFQADTDFIGYEISPGQHMDTVTFNLIVPVTMRPTDTDLSNICFVDTEQDVWVYDVRMDVIEDDHYFRFHMVGDTHTKVWLLNNDVANAGSFRASNISQGDFGYAPDPDSGTMEFSIEVANPDARVRGGILVMPDRLVIDENTYLYEPVDVERLNLGCYVYDISGVDTVLIGIDFRTIETPYYRQLELTLSPEVDAETGDVTWPIPDEVTVNIQTGNTTQKLNSAFPYLYPASIVEGAQVSFNEVHLYPSNQYFPGWPETQYSKVSSINYEDNPIDFTAEWSVTGENWDDIPGVDGNTQIGTVNVPYFMFLRFSQDVYVTHK